MGSALRIKPNSDDLFILAVAKNGMLEQAKDQVQDLLRVRRQVPFREPNNFSMETAASIVDQFKAITQGVFLAMIVISSSRSHDRRNRRYEHYACVGHGADSGNRDS